MTPRIRRARRSDLDALVRVHTSAYPTAGDAGARRAAFQRNRYGTLADVWVADVGGVVVGHALLHRARAWFGGALVDVGAIAAVGVAPEARGLGVGTALVEALHARAHARGDALTMLYAFRAGYYARFGYAASRPALRMCLSPRALPRGPRGLVRALGAADAPAMASVHGELARRMTGAFQRDARLFRRLLAARGRHALGLARDRGGRRLSGYVTFFLEQAEQHAETRLHVEELLAVDDASRRHLLAALSAMRDQVRELELEIALDDPLWFELEDPDRERAGTDLVEHTLGGVVGGPMVRIAEPARALEARGYLRDGSFALSVAHDGRAQVLTVDVRGGVARVTERRAARAAVHVDRVTLAALVFGGLRVSEAARLGRVEGPRAGIAAADGVLALPAPVPIDKF